MRRVLLFVVIACVLASVPASGAAEWTFASSDHFDIYTTTGDRRARETLAFFERVYTFFSVFGKITPPNRPIRLILFSNEREFRPYRINEAAVAYYRPGPDRDYIVMQSLGVEDDPIVVHEYVHLILGRSGRAYPVWLSEGLAEYYSTLSMTGNITTLGSAPNERLNELVSGRMLELDRLFQVTRDSADYRSVQHAGRFYADSWALTHMLLTQDTYRNSWSTFLNTILQGRPAATAFSTAYKKSLSAVAKDLDRYVRTERFRVRTMTFKPPAVPVTINTKAVSEFDAGLVEANLLAAAREDRPKAIAAFDELARQAPNNIEVLEARAMFEARSNLLDAARSHLARAVELGTTNTRTYRDFATLVTRTDPELETRLLETAVALEPQNVASRIRLAFSLFRQGGALDALDLVSSLGDPGPPEGFNLWQLRANAYLALERFDLARQAVRELQQRTATRAQRTIAAQLFTSVENAIGARDRAPAKPADGIVDVPPAPESGL